MVELLKRQTKMKDAFANDSLYYMLFNYSLDAVLVSSPDGIIFNANQTACEMFGCTVEEICAGGRSSIMDDSDPRLVLALEERNQTGKFFGELTCIRKDGSKFPVELASSMFLDKAGSTFTSIIIRDITERKKLEQQLLDRNELLSHFIKYSLLFRYNEVINTPKVKNQ